MVRSGHGDHFSQLDLGVILIYRSPSYQEGTLRSLMGGSDSHRFTWAVLFDGLDLVLETGISVLFEKETELRDPLRRIPLGRTG